MTFSSSHSQSGFTLVELMLAMSIFSVMVVMILTVYFNATNSSRKLNATRQLSETAREITERISQDVREYGLSGSVQSFDNSYPLWMSYKYNDGGSEYLNINKKGRYVYGKKTTSGMSPCIDNYGGSSEKTKSDYSIHCGLYIVEYSDNGTNAYNLVDSFIPEEDKKRVKVKDLRFYVSGNDSSSDSRKVLINFTLTLMPRIGVPHSLVNTTELHVQTTLSERIFKTY